MLLEVAQQLRHSLPILQSGGFALQKPHGELVIESYYPACAGDGCISDYLKVAVSCDHRAGRRLVRNPQRRVAPRPDGADKPGIRVDPWRSARPRLDRSIILHLDAGPYSLGGAHHGGVGTQPEAIA